MPLLPCEERVDTIKMGTQPDIWNHHANEHIDNHRRQSMVQCDRQIVFEQGIPLSSDWLKAVLSYFSGVPIGIWFDFHKIFVINLLHEFELRVWKAIFTYLCESFMPSEGTQCKTWINGIDRCFPLEEQDNMSVHRKSLSNVQTSCKGFQGSSAGNIMEFWPFTCMAYHFT